MKGNNQPPIKAVAFEWEGNVHGLWILTLSALREKEKIPFLLFSVCSKLAKLIYVRIFFSQTWVISQEPLMKSSTQCTMRRKQVCPSQCLWLPAHRISLPVIWGARMEESWTEQLQRCSIMEVLAMRSSLSMKEIDAHYVLLPDIWILPEWMLPCLDVTR